MSRSYRATHCWVVSWRALIGSVLLTIVVLTVLWTVSVPLRIMVGLADAVCITTVGLLDCVDAVDRAVLAARICRIRPWLARATRLAGGVERLVISMLRLPSVVVIVAVFLRVLLSRGEDWRRRHA